MSRWTRLQWVYKLRSTYDPKIPGRGTNLDIVRGCVVLRPGPVPPFLDAGAARHLAEDLAAATASATALDGFITARFGPTG